MTIVALLTNIDLKCLQLLKTANSLKQLLECLPEDYDYTAEDLNQIESAKGLIRWLEDDNRVNK